MALSSKLQFTASDASSLSVVGGTADKSSGMAFMVPPRRTVATADWHKCQFPVHSSPTAPFTGFTVRPQASSNRD
ncbi:hypothetical protein HanIR_Chr16g0801751 [Helianthus annuus]|nr:hypothetical protein HanIR_Chr16g0801751 [Helianthus annuus]